MEDSARKRSDDSKKETPAATVEELRRDLDDLSAKVDRALGDETSIQSKLYDLSASLAALTHQAGLPSPDPAYAQCVRRIRETVRRVLPRDAKVLVVSRGDDALLDLYGREAWHFPQEAGGEYLGYYPPDGLAVIAQLETLRVRGAQFLLFPATALWWLHEYPQFTRHLERQYPAIHEDNEACMIFALEEACPAAEPGSWKPQLRDLIADFVSERGDSPSILDWNTDLDLRESFPGEAIVTPPQNGRLLPYLGGSVDIVVVRTADRAVLSEAHRVAGFAVLTVHAADEAEDEQPPVEIERIDKQSSSGGMPSTSIVIPTHDGVDHLGLCLKSLTETLPDPFDGEVIVVDDGSGEEMQALLAEWQEAMPYLKVVRNAANRGFVASCNRGARGAKGDMLVFLNDDTVPQAGWLQALLRVFRERPDAGAVGGKLIFPDGRLQEAGSFVFSDGSAANFGRDDRIIESPLYSYVREVDYCSGALLATPRELFQEIGGFDKRYEPAYYEDTDYCFAVRAHGRRVYYQPESLVVHWEGGTGGTDLNAGVKRFQVVNQSKFAEKWKDMLQQQPRPPAVIDQDSLRGIAARAGAR
jgi:GT2 family glycosyltransferase